MRLKLKVILGAGALAAIPVIIACITIGFIASKESQVALQHAAEEHLVAVRDLSKERVEDYFSTINQQILNLSQNQLTIDAASSFSLGFSRYKKQANADIAQLKSELSQYYENDYLNEFKKRNNGKSIDTLAWLNQLSDDAIVLQHSMIQANTNALGEKNKLTDLENYSSYNRSHKIFHPSFDYYLQQFGYYDIFIVDSESSNIIYSVFKELDYATSLTTGPFKNSQIAKVFNQANQADDPSFVAISDFVPYLPSYNDPAAFIASPIFENDQKIAVLIFQMPIDNINKVMTHHHRWQEVGLGASGETYLVSEDKTLRSMNRSLIEDKNSYLQALKEASVSNEIIEVIDAKTTSIALQPANSPKIEDAINGESGINIYTDYRNTPLLSAYAPLKIKGLNWLILSEITVDEAFNSAKELTNHILVISIAMTIGLVIVSLIIGFFFANATTAPIIKLSKAINDIQVNSDLTKRLEVTSNDEIGMAKTVL
ncbi:HAMP domain-containing protein [Psychromonas sp. KJ10-10]|uniref:HAMP domain-containing protein n=1 Tax=Psychromonas sp. KJ10-10 TaxID=3391823 RepID=UPI0039B6BBF7